MMLSLWRLRLAHTAMLLVLVPSSSVRTGDGSMTKVIQAVSVSSGQRPTPPDSQLAHFLSLAIATRVPRVGRLDSVYTREEEEYNRVRWLADFKVIGVALRGDSALATAVITTVADQVDRGRGWVATPRIETDTAHWQMARSRDGERRWLVCGDAVEGFGVLMVGREVRWRPATASARTARAAVDSIRRARGLTIVR